MAIRTVTTIRVLAGTKQRLDRFGMKGETYDDILNNLLDAPGGRDER